MKKIRNAYYQGIEGQPLPVGSSKVRRIAHRLGQRTLATELHATENREATKQAEFNDAAFLAQGVNRQALSVIQAVADIPHQRDPRQGNAWLDKKRVPEKVQWHVHLVGKNGSDPGGMGRIPLVAELGSLHLDSTEWSHNGINLPVETVRIVSTSRRDAEGKIQAPSTLIHINELPYEVADDPDEPGSITGALRLEIDPTGEVSKFGVTREGISGYVDEDPTKARINLGQFLEALQRPIDETVQAYQSVAG